MKKFLYIIGSLVFGILTIIASHEGVPVLPELAMLIAFVLMVRNRHSIAHFFSIKKAPMMMVVIISLIPFMVFEENINCFPPEAGGCQLFPITYPFLIAEIAIVYLIVKKFKLKNFWRIVTIASILGVVWEITIGVAATEFLALPPLWIILVASWTWLSYAILFIIPLTVQLDARENNR